MESLKITTLLSLSLVVFGLVSIQALEYGQSCTPSDPRSCVSENIKDPLTCGNANKTCQCLSDMFRHDTLDRCVSPHGGNCTLQTGNGEPFKTCTDFAECWPNNDKPVTNAEVVGICHCDLDAKFDNFTGKCKLIHGSNRCEFATQCDVMGSLTCLNGECVCHDQEHQIYDEVKEKCVALVGGSCARQPPFPTPECGANMNCTEDKCKCLEGFDETLERKCGKKYGGECKESSDCHPQFICRAFNTSVSHCSCRDGQEYHQNSTTCRILVGESCNASTTEFQCTPHASCTQEKCACDDGYKVDPDTKKCIALFGSPCSDEAEGITCNTEDFLECNNNTKICQCKANYESNDAEKKCRGFIEEECRNNDDDSCIANSICSAPDNKCSCGERQVKSDDRKQCFALLDAPCNFETECSPTHHLVCTDGSTCGCTNSTLRDDSYNGCRAMAGSPCGPSAGGIDCGGNATCTDNICNCKPGYAQNSNGVCVTAAAGSGSSSMFGSLFLLGSVILGTLSMRKF